MSVEVERKFVCDAGMRKRLEEIGAVCIGQCEFHDQYFDTPEFDLTLRNIWLRKRKESWELKCPTAVSKTEETSGEQPTEASLCTRYKEITSLPEIKLKVKEVFKRCAGGSINTGQLHDHLVMVEQVSHQEQGGPEGFCDSWPGELNLLCFAEFTTVRCSFTLEEEGVQIDLDQADFGYSVGEIEVLVQEGQDVGSAMEKIERAARKLSEDQQLDYLSDF
ncbi:Thiamine-triphosphatase [Merluccius polli]|uniref:Thiamine-triphosphatase n=1 Tax=Merluccius polli TaxID=89951 RepID=A0AA47MR46_MERPO|nr:Thiamine-triphosphatase [Merluccius polli]